MITSSELRSLVSAGGNAIDPDGHVIGSLSETAITDEANPLWIAVRFGLLGRHETFLPIDNGTVEGNDIRVTYVKDMVEDAPRNSGQNGHMNSDLRAQLIEHYGVHEDGTEPHLMKDL